MTNCERWLNLFFGYKTLVTRAPLLKSVLKMIKDIWEVRRDRTPLPGLGRRRQENYSKFKASLKNFNLKMLR